MAPAAEQSVILVEHKMKLAMGICERLPGLHCGEFLDEPSEGIVHQGDAQALLDDRAIQDRDCAV